MPNPQPASALAKVLSTDPSAACAKSETSSRPALTELDSARLGILERIWSVLIGIYGHKFTTNFGDAPILEDGNGAGRQWAVTLQGLSRSQIESGLEASHFRVDEWPPTATEFRMLCLGIPSLAAVRQDLAKDSRERMPFTRLTWEFIDGYNFGRSDQDKANRMLRDAYDLAREHVMAGGALPEGPVNYLEQAAKERPTPATDEKVRAVMADIANVLGADPADIVEVSAFEAPDSLHHHQVKTHDGTAVTIVNPWRLDRFELQKRVRVAWANQHAEPANPAPARAFGDDQERAA